MSEKYTVVLRNQEFTLRRSQIDFDAPNYFTACFFGEFKESKSTTIVLDRNPELFALIVEYLSGYNVFPIATKALPKTMDTQAATLNLVEDAAFYGLSRLHSLLTRPTEPSIDFTWTGLAGKVITFEDVLNMNLPDRINYTTNGLCSFHTDPGKPVIIFARNIPIRLVGNLELDKSGRPTHDATTATYWLDLSMDQKARLERQPYSAFEFNDVSPRSLNVSVFPESLLHLDGQTCHFEKFPAWWRNRRTPFNFSPSEIDDHSTKIFDNAFPRPYDDAPRREEWDRNEFVLWADELLFIITARGFIAGTLQLHVKLLDVRARTRATILQTLRPPALIYS